MFRFQELKKFLVGVGKRRFFFFITGEVNGRQIYIHYILYLFTYTYIHTYVYKQTSIYI